MIVAQRTDNPIRLPSTRRRLYVVPLVVAAVVSSQAKADSIPMSIGQPADVVVPSGGEIGLTVEITNRQPLLITVTQGMDVTVTHVSPDGRVVSFDAPGGRSVLERLVLESPNAGTHQIVLKAREYTGAPKTSQLHITSISSISHVPAGLAPMSAAASTDESLTLGERLRLLHQSAEEAREGGEFELAAQAFFSIAWLHYWETGSWNEVVSAAAEAKELYLTQGDDPRAARARALEGAALIEAANLVPKSPTADVAVPVEAADLFAKAQDAFEQALAVQERLGLHYDAAQTLNNMGLTYHYQGEWASARDYYAQAAEKFATVQELGEQAKPLANIGVIDLNAARLQSAVGSFRQVLELLPDTGASDVEYGRAVVSHNLGVALWQIGEVDEALDYFLQALKVHVAQGNRGGQGQALNGIGVTYYLSGDYRTAIDNLELALEHSVAAGDGATQLSTLRYLGEIHRRLAAPANALDFDERAVRLATSPLDRAKTSLSIARDRLALDNVSGALRATETAAASADIAGSPIVRSEIHLERGRALLRQGDADAAITELDEALATFDALELQGAIAETHYHLALAHSDAGQETTALTHARQAVESIERFRKRVVNPNFRAALVSSRFDAHELLINLLLSGLDPSAARVREAFAAAEMARSRTLADLIVESRANIAETMAPNMVSEQRTLRATQLELRARLERTFASVDLAQMRSQMLRTEAELDVLEARMRRANPKYAQITSPDSLDVAQVQALLPENATLIQYSLGTPHSHLWVVSRDAIVVERLPPRHVIDQMVRVIYGGLSRGRDASAVIVALSDAVWRPAERHVGGGRMFIVPDGSLQLIPFAVFSRGAHQPDNLPQITYLPSMTVAARSNQTRTGQAQPERTIAVIADPVFSSADPRMPQPAREEEPDAEPRLAGTLREARVVERLAEPGERLIATGFDANRGLVTSNELAKYRFVHFATHGRLDTEFPTLSSLSLSRYLPSGERRDGSLRLHDVYGLKLNADLVVLSACETAIGDEMRGESLSGFTQAFLYAGARGVLASLWKVPDRATAELMSHFYQNVLQSGFTPAVAFQRAQAAIAAQRRWEDPYYWAAFVLQGDASLTEGE